MKRLIDSEAPDVATERAQEVLRRVRPLAASEARLQRVRRALDAAPVSGGRRGVPRFRGGWGARAVGIAILAGVGVAAAAAGSAWWTATEHGVDAGEPPSERSRSAAPRVEPSAHDPAPSPRLESKPSPSDPSEREPSWTEPSEAQPSEAQPSEAQPSGDNAPKAAPRANVAGEAAARTLGPATGRTPTERGARTTPSTPRQPTEVELLHAAATALRRDRDPQRALQLLEGVSGSGAFEEEALALRVEAAARAGDPRGPQLARTYLTRFPAGRYAERVRESLRASSPP